MSARNPLEEFFEADRRQDEDKPIVYGLSYKASELCLKSWDDLQKLWYVLLKEKNMLMTQRQMLHSQNLSTSIHYLFLLGEKVNVSYQACAN